MYYTGAGGHKINLGTDEPTLGLVNVAMFMTQSVFEKIQYDSCDEQNIDGSSEQKFPLSNACGQFGNDYQSSVCDHDYACPVDDSLQVSGSQRLGGGPPGFACGPDAPTGYWQNGTVFPGGFANSVGREDAIGCCFWNRGAFDPHPGRCNYGRLDRLLGRPKGINLCSNPQALCENADLRWDAGLLNWAVHIQTGTYLSDLNQLIESELQDVDEFALQVTGQVSAKTQDLSERQEMFRLILYVLGIGESTFLSAPDNDDGQPNVTSSPIQTNPGQKAKNPLITIIGISVAGLIVASAGLVVFLRGRTKPDLRNNSFLRSWGIDLRV